MALKRITDEEIEKAFVEYVRKTFYPETKKGDYDQTVVITPGMLVTRDAQLEADQAQIRDGALLFESRIVGIDEFNDWGEEGLRAFRKGIMPIINEFVKALKGGK